MTGKGYWMKVLGEPVPDYNRTGKEWVFDFTPDDEGMALIKELKIKDKMKFKSDERGDFITFKQKEFQANGKRNLPVTVVDARNQPWDPKLNERGEPTNKIGNGSTVEVKFRVVEYGKGMPTGVYPQAIRVLEHVPFVRQEFSPLPEDSKYFQHFENDQEVLGDGGIEGDVLEG